MRKASQKLRAILASNIRNYRKHKGLSQEKLADICGLHRTYVGAVERGERNVTLSTLEVFSASLGVSVPELLTERDCDESSR
ncbi:helix-turn-helix domain-containing protein [Desulfonema ishimotonii]|uniref:helix-turn-helix domain-containing protein n=1 Tax=Desulfonema ishimotonii TaxID=45657 RepID=UPI000F56B9B7|nr:helix-turn-helix transcriptional regulator [Desulfonema ishimotonii]